MSEKSLREHELGNEKVPQLEFRELPAYDPDEEAYKVDAANDPYQKLGASIEAGATIELRLPCQDGRLELVELDNQESKAWIRDPFKDRLTYANQRIREGRATRALRAAQRNVGKQVLELSDLRPDEEAALREFDMLEDWFVPRDEGGYDRKLALKETNVARASSRLREDGFWDGSFDDAAGFGYDAPTDREYLPRGGPLGQQQLISDVWDTQAKCYYAWTHDPIIRCAVELITDFVLGRGISVIATKDVVQPIIDEFLNRELLPQSQQAVTPWGPGRITNRLHDMATSLWRDGELMVRKIPLGDGRLKVRTMPVETIWEIITDADDALEVYWYVQRYQTRNVLLAPANMPQTHTQWIERNIMRNEMIHTLINAKESDVRGRSDIYPALGWAKRLRDFFDAKIQKEYAGAAYQWWYKVSGGATNIQALASSVIPSSRPRPGSFIMTNDAVDVSSTSSQIRGTVSGEGTAYDALVNHIALSFVLNKSYFGADAHANRATALVATEPTAKHLEARQDLFVAFLTQLLNDVVSEAVKYGKIPKGTDLSFKVQLPSIIKADAAARGLMIRQAEGMGYVSKQTAAETYCAEAEIPDYDFDGEQTKLKKELGEEQNPLQLIMKDVEMVAKGAPEPTQPAWSPGEVPNLGYVQPGAKPSNGAVPSNGKTPAAADPHDASPTSGTGAAAIRNELGHGSKGDRSTMEGASLSDAAFAEEVRRRGLFIIKP